MGDTSKQFSLQNFRPEGYAYPIGLSLGESVSNVAPTTTGGTITADGSGPTANMVHTFTTSNTFTAGFTGNAEVLLVGGGGGGGAGGGGAGGLVFISSYPVVIGSGYTVTIGAGGPYRTVPASPPGNPDFNVPVPGLPVNGNGSNTSISSPAPEGKCAIALYGGGGGVMDAPPAAGGCRGGSGGGGAGGTPILGPYNSPFGLTAAPSIQGPGGPGGGTGSGSAGGAGVSRPAAPGPTVDLLSGGGGGAGGAGGAAPPNCNTAGAGGSGLTYSISGSPVTYAGGGGGAAGNSGYTGSSYLYPASGYIGGSAGPGGGGGGGNVGPGPYNHTCSTSGTANRGGGGGGNNGPNPPAGCGGGGSGIVIVRYVANASVPVYSIN